MAEFTDALAADGVPANLVPLFRYLFTEVLDGRNSAPVDGVRQALGRDATDFTTFVATAAAAGVWRTEPTDGEDR